MEEKSTQIGYLIQIAEAYANTNLSLVKLKTISKSTDVLSSIILKIVIYTVLSIMFILLSIGLSIWIGELLGKLYYGFFILTGVYILVAFVLYYIPSLIKSPVKNYLILKMQKNKEDEK